MTERSFSFYKEAFGCVITGDMRPFIRFIANCTEDTVDEYIAVLTEHPDRSNNVASFVDDGRTIIVDEGDEDNSQN